MLALPSVQRLRANADADQGEVRAAMDAAVDKAQRFFDRRCAMAAHDWEGKVRQIVTVWESDDLIAQQVQIEGGLWRREMDLLRGAHEAYVVQTHSRHSRHCGLRS